MDMNSEAGDGALGPTEWHIPGVIGKKPWLEEYPHLPLPHDARYDPVLLELGDQRNVIDQYRYWRREAIIADLDPRRHNFEVAIENFAHDHNIGTVVRTANAFLAKKVHIIGKKRWNRRGAMVTDRYQHLEYWPEAADLIAYSRNEGLTIVAVENGEKAQPIERITLPEKALLIFGQEGPGITEATEQSADIHVSIAQFGSTRSINAGVAAGIVMHHWIVAHANIDSTH